MLVKAVFRVLLVAGIGKCRGSQMLDYVKQVFWATFVCLWAFSFVITLNNVKDIIVLKDAVRNIEAAGWKAQ